jgi:hypothetical protein
MANFLGSLMNKAGDWLKQTFPPLAAVVDFGQKLLDTGRKLKEIYDTGLIILEREKIAQKNPKEDNKPNIVINVSPPFLSLPSSKKKEITVKPSEIRAIQTQQTRAEEAQKRLLLQIKILELVTTSQTIEKFTDNIGIHAANLNIHFMSLKNTIGLLEFTNRNNKGLRAVIAKVNLIIRLLIKERVVKRGLLEEISNIDLERKQGAITILGQYNAFMQTQELIEIESRKLIDSIDRQLEQVEELKVYAGDSSAKREVTNWLDKSVIPHLTVAKQNTILLTESLSEIPKLAINKKDKEIQNQLSAEGISKSIKPKKVVKPKKQTKRTKSIVRKKTVKRKK